MFDQLRKGSNVTVYTPDMPFSTEVSEKTKLMALDTWVGEQIKARKAQLEEWPNWSKEKKEGYERGLIDALLDMKNQLKKLKQ